MVVTQLESCIDYKDLDLSENTPCINQIDFGYCTSALWSKRYLILAVTLMFSIISVFTALRQPIYYQADTLIIPSNNTSMRNSISSKYSLLASISGINLSNYTSNMHQVALELIRTRWFIQQFLSNKEILPEVVAATGWDKRKNTIKLNSSIYNSSTQEWLKDGNVTQPPTVDELKSAFHSMVTIVDTAEDGTISIKVRHFSPTLAMQICNWLIEEINRTIRDQEISRANDMVNLLQEKLLTTPNIEDKQLIYTILDEQKRIKLMASGQKDYVFRVLDPAVTPIKPLGNRRLIAVVGTIMGFLITCFGILILKIFPVKTLLPSLLRGSNL